MAAEKKSDSGLDQSIDIFRASLERTVTVSRDRLQEVLDDAVDRGRMTRRDAEAVLSELIDKGRRQRDQLLDELERLGKHLGKRSEKVARHAREVTEKPLVKAEKKLRRRATAEKPDARFPIPDYDSLNATDVRKRLADLSAAQLKAVREREAAGSARKTVLEAIDKKLESSN